MQLRPRADQLHVSQDRTVLLTGRDGFIHADTQHGLFFHQTRLLSHYEYLINGQAPTPVALSNVEQHSWLGYYIEVPPGMKAAEPDLGSGHLEQSSQETLELRLSRYIGTGLHEDVDLTNFTQCSTTFELSLKFDADYCDASDVQAEHVERDKFRGAWRALEKGVWEFVFDYHVEHQYQNQNETGTAQLNRGAILRIENATSEPRHARGQIIFSVTLGPQGKWHACINLLPQIEGEIIKPVYQCHSFFANDTQFDRLRNRFVEGATHFVVAETGTLTHVVAAGLEQAIRDLAALRLHDLDEGEQAWTMAAGLPIYIALFGRDTLTTALQAAILSPEMMKGTLPVLARYQGTETNDWRDEQPGRMLHEAHTGPLEILNYNPRQRYYGALTTSGFYPAVVADLWHWTGDKELVRPYIEPALRALKWIDKFADLDDDGFSEYRTRSKLGVRNQGWKDSGDCMVYEDGAGWFQ